MKSFKIGHLSKQSGLCHVGLWSTVKGTKRSMMKPTICINYDHHLGTPTMVEPKLLEFNLHRVVLEKRTDQQRLIQSTIPKCQQL